jgi:hypothetical protein
MNVLCSRRFKILYVVFAPAPPKKGDSVGPQFWLCRAGARCAVVLALARPASGQKRKAQNSIPQYIQAVYTKIGYEVAISPYSLRTALGGVCALEIWAIAHGAVGLQHCSMSKVACYSTKFPPQGGREKTVTT